MYKVVFIDDELMVRKNIIKKIEWEKYGFCIVGEADNGRDALDVIDFTNPDVIITDIDMPFMDGLEMAKIVTEKYPMIKIVILSGFDEFKYAQQAIELNVTEYVLKPISADGIIKILMKIKAIIDGEIFNKENIDVLRRHYIESLPVLKGNFLSTLVVGKQRKEDILNKANYYNIDLKGDTFACAVVSIDKNVFNEKKLSEEEEELNRYGVLNIMEEVVCKHSLGIVFSHDNHIVCIIVDNEKSKECMISKIFRVLEEVRQAIEKYMKFTVTIGIGGLCTSIKNIDGSFYGGLSALEYRFVTGNNKLIYIDDLEPEKTKNIIFDDNKEHILLSSIKFGTEEDVYNAIKILFEDITEVKVSFSDYQIYILEVLAAITRMSKDLTLDFSSILDPNYNIFVEMFKFNTNVEVKEWFEKICIKIMNSIGRKRKNSGKIIVDKALEYVRENYADSDLSLNKVSSFIHISPNYFGNIFKTETGETFANYLLRIRMEIAKDILCSTNYKNLQIAEKVGISDQYYFSHCFKKYFKSSPKEVRNSFNK
ncbi:response regulator [Clostridium lacusfryxellense]|uniref:response regulator n=1 Tax=Clostridium lacusfryxellense TaxID=205328 RepID=UPI001C0E8643|nr:response regulator [Clostridium lacusfryxellense]MBU3114148.1 response regulator [Clostridium lacusfryxellense]